jgi:predicted enzyme related to lactoylglutathione lyase
VLRPVHFEIPADDPEKNIAFFEKVFGWKFQKWEGPVDYYFIVTGQEGPGLDGGLMKRMHPGQPVVNTIDVPSIDDFAEKITEAGGQIVVPKMVIPGIGWLAYFKDPDGNVHGIMQDDTSAA